MVPWILSQPRPPKVADTCQRFGISRSQLVEDLSLLMMCGVYPFTPDTMVEATVYRDRVVIQSSVFTRSPRPDPGQALALVAAARAVCQAPGAPEALRRGLAKLEAALPGGLGRALVVDLDAPDMLADLREALASEKRVEIDYFSYTRDALATRRVDPAEVFSAMGQWYLAGWCYLAGGPRRFRVDRIRRLAVLDEPASRAGEARGLDPSYRAGEDDVTVVLRITSAAAWLREYYPLEREEELTDGGWRVELKTSSPEWLTRLALRLGPDAVIEQPQSAAEAAAHAARHVLHRYGERATA